MMSKSFCNEQALTAGITAARLGISLRHLYRLCDQGLPAVGTGRARRFDWRTTFDWYQQHLAQQIGGKKASGLVREQIRRMAAQASREELKLQRERKEVVSVVEIQREIENACYNVKTRLLALPSRLAPRLCG